MTKLQLERPLISFDLETTGIDIVEDRIVQIALRKMWIQEGQLMHKDYEWLVNPGIPISPEASEVHGIYISDVADKPDFHTIAPTLFQIFDGCDLLGFNSNRFDIPILGEHFLKSGIIYPQKDTKFIDAQVIFHEHNPRNLEAAYKFYCNKSLGDDAHDAKHDMIATAEILFSQIQMYEDIGTTVESLHDASQRGDKIVDYARRLIYNKDGDMVFNFGKNKGDRVKDNTGFAFWVLDKNFSAHTKYCIREELGMPHPEIAYKLNDDIF